MNKDAETINNLISDLASYDDSIRRNARFSLVSIGKRTIPHLIEALRDGSDSVRWEATKALSEIGDPEAAPALVEALGDEEFDIRWTAAEGLTEMNVKGLRALFLALEQKPDSSLLREGAHHVLHSLARGELKKYLAPVVAALEGPAPIAQTLTAAYRAMEDMQKAKIL
ncbi:MAG TPA: HEAT repeat domain-containing protein [Thermodesulfobacteriota bacterium]|nr:HEAT repeat domain-containing protein [Thermodesulfobacteriota bacterium]